MKSKILIISGEGYNKNNMPHFEINYDYGKAIASAGGLPMVALDVLHPEDYVELADGLLLTGGPDIHCGRYGEFYENEGDVPPLQCVREEFELKMCKLFTDAGKPVFGIGRGMQMINLFFGGSLYRDVADKTSTVHFNKSASDERSAHNIEKFDFASHKVSVNPDSKLAAVFNNVETVNSFHHQAVKELGVGLIASAECDGIIEAVEHVKMPVFGVQWHPEHSEQQLGADNRIFEYFISLCGGKTK